MKLKHTGKKIVRVEKTISIVVDLEAYKKMKCYIDLCDKEVGWLGTAYKVGSEIRITDVFLFDQEVHATTCELTPGGIADFVTNLYNTMDADEAMEISNNLTCWGHSHVRMGVSPSGQDDIQLRSFSTSGHDWFLRVIGNKYGEFEYTYIDYNTGIEIKDLDWRIDIPGLDLDELKPSIQEEMKQKVRNKQYITHNYWKQPNRVNFIMPHHTDTVLLSNSRYNSKYSDKYDRYIEPEHLNTSLFDDDYFDKLISKHKKEEIEIKSNKPTSNSFGIVSDNHDTIMEIIDGKEGTITTSEYELLDRALCMLTFDDLAYIATLEEMKDAEKYITDNADDELLIENVDVLYSICKDCKLDEFYDLDICDDIYSEEIQKY